MLCLKLKSVPLYIMLVVLISGCTTLPPAPPQPVVNSLSPASTGTIDQLSKRISDKLKHKHSAYFLLSRNDDALNWRLALVDNVNWLRNWQLSLKDSCCP